MKSAQRGNAATEMPASEGEASFQKAGSVRFSAGMLLAGTTAFSLLYIPQPLLPLFAEEFAIGGGEAGLAVSLTSGAMAVGILAGGVLCAGFDRRRLIAVSLGLAAVLTIVTAFVSQWHLILGLRILTGLALSGTPAVAMAHISAETRGANMASAMGFYVAGTGLGGVAGRLGASWVAELSDWRWGCAVTGVLCVLAAIAFFRFLPASTQSQPDVVVKGIKALRDMLALLKNRALVLLYAQAFLFMGVFLTVFSFVGFRLAQSPFGLSQAVIGSIFLLFLIGSLSSAYVGWTLRIVSRELLLPLSLIVMTAGVAMTLSTVLMVFMIGLILIVIGFFSAHAVASNWVSARASGEAAQAAALYLFFYHLGSAVVSAVGGFAWQLGSWIWLVIYLLALSGVALAVSLKPLVSRSRKQL